VLTAKEHLPNHSSGPVSAEIAPSPKRKYSVNGCGGSDCVVSAPGKIHPGVTDPGSGTSVESIHVKSKRPSPKEPGWTRLSTSPTRRDTQGVVHV